MDKNLNSIGNTTETLTDLGDEAGRAAAGEVGGVGLEMTARGWEGTRCGSHGRGDGIAEGGQRGLGVERSSGAALGVERSRFGRRARGRSWTSWRRLLRRRRGDLIPFCFSLRRRSLMEA
ncbi:Uncharacterized protein Rs2_05460 [Raphanus sativus]|nr:Uncharacterized protein Rs2_05460 [Raphanus sativus]